MLTAITRKVSSSLPNCELNFIERKPIDMERRGPQHHAYESLLERLGANVNSLPEERDLPDSMFVEDPAICSTRCRDLHAGHGDAAKGSGVPCGRH